MRKTILWAANVMIIALALGACSSEPSPSATTTASAPADFPAVSSMFLDLSWQTATGEHRRLIASADGSVVTSDSTSVTRYRQHRVPVSAVADATGMAAAAALSEEDAAACDESEESVRAHVVTAEFEWQYDGSVAGDQCQPKLRHVADHIWSDLSAPAGLQTDEYAERFVLYLNPLTDEDLAESPDARPWPLRTPLSALPVRWDDEDARYGCVQVSGDEVLSRDFIRDSTAYNKLVVQTDGQPIAYMQAGLDLLLPKENSCAPPISGAAHREDTLDSLSPEEAVIDARTHFLTGVGVGSTVIVRADGQAVVNDATSATGYVVRQISPTLVLAMAREAAEVFDAPKSEACEVNDGASVTYRGRTDQGSWMGLVLNPSVCGWPEVDSLVDSLRGQIIESGATPTPFKL